MKTFELPISDCGCFVGGKIDKESFNMGEDMPAHGVIVWYQDADDEPPTSVSQTVE